MFIRIYQINLDRDVERTAFESLEWLERATGRREVNSGLYEMVYEGDVACNGLEGVFRIFNMEHPTDYTARSLSVSDIVEVVQDEKYERGFYFCDSFEFVKVEFHPEQAV